MAVRVYKSTDTGAPTLSGTAGAAITVLDAVLVNGYNTQAITSITRTSNTATVTTTGSHGFVTGDYIAISGANESDYNGNFYITVTSGTTFTYTVANTPTTPATGTISSEKASAGWTKTYSGTNKAAYTQGAGSNGFLLRVDDSNAQYGLARGYEAMTDVDTGTNPFPTVAQMTNGVFFQKSDTASSSARPWVIVANDEVVHFYSQYSATANTGSAGALFFGDVETYKSGDAYHTMIFGDSSSSAMSAYNTITSFLTTTATAHYFARSYTQTGSSVLVGKHSDYAKNAGAGTLGGNGIAYPNGPDGGFYLAPVWAHETTSPGHVRGKVPGLWNPCHSRSTLVTAGVNNFDTFSGSGDLAGKTFIVLILSTVTCMALETSNTW